MTGHFRSCNEQNIIELWNVYVVVVVLAETTETNGIVVYVTSTGFLWATPVMFHRDIRM